MKFNALVGNVVRGANASRAGVVVVELPSENRAIRAHPGFRINDTGGTEVCPSEFFLARPHELHWSSRRLRQTRRFHRSVAGVLAAIRGTGVGYDDPKFFNRQVKRF